MFSWRTKNKLGIYIGLGLLFLWPRSSSAIFGDSRKIIGLDGSVRTITALTRNYDNPLLFGPDNRMDGISQTLLRITLGGMPSDWITYELHGVMEVDFSTQQGQDANPMGLLGASGGLTRYQVWDASLDWSHDRDTRILMWLDRCNVKLMLPFADLTIGRQAISFGKAYFWNPLDVYLAFDPRRFDRDYKAGVDAARLDWSLGDFSGLNLVMVLGRSMNFSSGFDSDAALDASVYGSSWLVRFFTNLYDWDIAVQTGKVYGGWQAGLAFSGELYEVALRAEGSVFRRSVDKKLTSGSDEAEIPDHASIVLGTGYRFSNDLHVELEYFINGAGDLENLEAGFLRMVNASSFHLGRHLLGAVVGYEILPILQSNFAWIVSFSDGSSLLQPGMVLSISDESDLLFGAMLPIGRRPRIVSKIDLAIKSEFGLYPYVFYTELKLYF